MAPSVTLQSLHSNSRFSQYRTTHLKLRNPNATESLDILSILWYNSSLLHTMANGILFHEVRSIGFDVILELGIYLYLPRYCFGVNNSHHYRTVSTEGLPRSETIRDHVLQPENKHTMNWNAASPCNGLCNFGLYGLRSASDRKSQHSRQLLCFVSLRYRPSLNLGSVIRYPDKFSVNFLSPPPK
jgi:hypothetical protein